jgi:hypothetical protein
MTAKRQKILDKAFAQLRKSREEMDPRVLSRIRRIIAGSPEMMKKLGLSENLKPQTIRKEEKPSSQEVAKQPVRHQKEEKASRPLQKTEEKSSYEKIDQARNMEVMAKLMELSPDNKDKIKSMIKKEER